MRKSRFSEEQIIGILKLAEAGVAVSGLCRQNAISDATYNKWRNNFRWLDVVEARRLLVFQSTLPCGGQVNGPEPTKSLAQA